MLNRTEITNDELKEVVGGAAGQEAAVAEFVQTIKGLSQKCTGGDSAICTKISTTADADRRNSYALKMATNDFRKDARLIFDWHIRSEVTNAIDKLCNHL